MLTDKKLIEIEERHKERREYRRHIPSGNYLYDSLGFISNDTAPRKSRIGILVRRREWFDALEMDDRLAKADHELAPDLGQYIAQVVEDDVERDIAALLTEIRALRSN